MTVAVTHPGFDAVSGIVSMTSKGVKVFKVSNSRNKVSGERKTRVKIRAAIRAKIRAARRALANPNTMLTLLVPTL